MKYMKYCLALLLALTVTVTLFRPATTMAKYVDKTTVENVNFTLDTTKETYEITNLAQVSDLTTMNDGDTVSGYKVYNTAYDRVDSFGQVYYETNDQSQMKSYIKIIEPGSSDAWSSSCGGILVWDQNTKPGNDAKWWAQCQINENSKYYVRLGLDLGPFVGTNVYITYDETYGLWYDVDYSRYLDDNGDVYRITANGPVLVMEDVYNMDYMRPITEEEASKLGIIEGAFVVTSYDGLSVFINGPGTTPADTKVIVARDMYAIFEDMETPGGWCLPSCIVESPTVGSFYTDEDRMGIGFSMESVAMNVNYSVTDMMIVDLTETFGAGNEPPLWWCDKYLPWVATNETGQTVKWFPEDSLSALDTSFYPNTTGYYADGPRNGETNEETATVDQSGNVAFSGAENNVNSTELDNPDR